MIKKLWSKMHYCKESFEVFHCDGLIGAPPPYMINGNFFYGYRYPPLSFIFKEL